MTKSKLVEVEWFKNPKSLSEIYQQTGMIFAFVTTPEDGNKMCHEWAKCRDFLHDAVRAQLTGNGCSIYGFTFDPKVNPHVDTRKMRMLVSKHGLKKDEVTAFQNKMVSALALINHFEKVAKISLTKLAEVNAKGSSKGAVFLFTGPRMWIQSPFLVSMYTFLLRLGDKELKFKNADELKKELKDLYDRSQKGKISDNDASYLGASWNKMHEIIKNRAELFSKSKGVHDIYWKKFNISQFHNNAGIRSLALGSTPDQDLNKRVKEIVK
jgi:hypothetical protein